MILRTPEEIAQYEADRAEMYARAKKRAQHWYKYEAPKKFKTLGVQKTKWPEWYYNGNYYNPPEKEEEVIEIKESELF